MAGLTRQELKKDEIRDTFEQFEQFAKGHAKDLMSGALIVVVIVGLALGLKLYMDRQEEEANAELGGALRTFRAEVGPPPPGEASGIETYPTAREKYQKALGQFLEITRKYPRTKAGAIARYQMGVCYGLVGDASNATKTLQEAARASDRIIASLARLALANELAATGKVQEALKLYQELADHPTVAVPRATALLEMAKASRPAQARQIYDRLKKDYASQTAVVEAVKEQTEGLPR